MTELKAQLDALRDLKEQLRVVREEQESTPDRARYDFLKVSDARIRNLIYDASLDFSEAFKSAFGVYPSDLAEATSSHGYVISKEYPVRDRS